MNTKQLEVQNMADIIPPSKRGKFKIWHHTPSEFEVLRQKIKFAEAGLSHFNHTRQKVAILGQEQDGYPQTKIMMSDSSMERESNEAILEKAHGDVLIAGLGIGMIIVPMLKNSKINNKYYRFNNSFLIS